MAQLTRHPEFIQQQISENGRSAMTQIGEAFDVLLETLETIIGTTSAVQDPGKPGYALTQARIRLEEACFYARKEAAITNKQ